MLNANILYKIPDSISLLDNANGYCFVLPKYENEEKNNATLNMIEKLVHNGLSLSITETYVVQLGKNDKVILPANALNIILMGVATKQIGLNLKQFDNKLIELNQKKYLITYNALDVLNDTQKKKLMWQEITKMK